jgi:enoyl-CoA hydratase/carnithine racemase
MSFETIRFEVENRIATMTLNRPDRMNAMNQQMKDDLRACWTRVKEDADIWVAIVTGAGDTFSAGADVDTLDKKGFVKPDRWRELCMQENLRTQPTPRRMHVHKPVIAAVNGLVGGVSLDHVTEADIPIASERAEFFDPHVSIGYVSSHEMVNMVRRVPPAVAMRMALLGKYERMSAQRAYEVGLVTEVVEHERLMDRARELAEILLKNAPLALWGTKLGIQQGFGLPFAQADDIAVGYLEVVEQSEDHKEGPRAFVEKRKPNWKAK